MYDYEVIRSQRKTISLEITKEGSILVRAPQRMKTEDIQRFVEQHESWLKKHLADRPAPMPEPTAEELTALADKAQAILPGLVAAWSERMGLRPTGITITGARKRYGSCSGKNRLCFSCFLMKYPMEAIELVVVHELCHIKEKNHGPAFYALLERYLPDHRERKKLLR